MESRTAETLSVRDRQRGQPQSQLEAIVERLAPRAFRRPLAKGEAAPFVRLGMEVLENGGSFDRAIRTSLRAILTSPQFLFLMPEPGKLDDFSLASRLALFLWQGLPDTQLFRLASQKQLASPDTLRSQVERMLLARRSQRMIEDFAKQWLRLSEIDATSPDMHLYPEFDELLKQAMLAESKEYLAYMIANNEPCERILNSDYTFLNRRLAEHYGIEGVEGHTMRKVNLPANSPRGGILTQAAILKITANGTTTSPVRRGSWVLTHVLGQPPNPPPPSVGSIERIREEQPPSASYWISTEAIRPVPVAIAPSIHLDSPSSPST